MARAGGGRGGGEALAWHPERRYALTIMVRLPPDPGPTTAPYARLTAISVLCFAAWCSAAAPAGPVAPGAGLPIGGEADGETGGAALGDGGEGGEGACWAQRGCAAQRLGGGGCAGCT